MQLNRKNQVLFSTMDTRRKKQKRAVELVSKILQHPNLREDMQIAISQHNLVQGYVDIEHGSNTIPCIQFHHESVDECMRRYILAPSKVRSKTKLMTVVEEINTLWTFIDLSVEED